MPGRGGQSQPWPVFPVDDPAAGVKVASPRRILWERPSERMAPKEQPAPETLRQMDRRRMGLWKAAEAQLPPTDEVRLKRTLQGA